MAKKPTAAAKPADGAKAVHRVTLSKVVTIRGFVYKPGHEHTVSDAILAEMQAAGAVKHVAAA